MIMIDVFALARTGAQREGSCPVAQLPRLAASLARPEGAIAWRCRGLIDELGRPAMDLALRATLVLRCDRCGAHLDFALDVQRRFFFVAGEEELASVPIDESPEEALLGGEQFDLAALIEDETILQLPLSPRHDHCTAPVESGVGQEREHPFAGLGALRDALRGQAAAEAGPEAGGNAAPGARKRLN